MPGIDADRLLKAAAEATKLAHAPYSRFQVGAALLADDGQVFQGCNIENASYGLTICAERTALSSAIIGGRRKFLAIAVVASGDAVPYPCGACRQVLAEFCGPELQVIVAPLKDLKAAERSTLGALLPKAFKLQAGPPSP